MVHPVESRIRRGVCWTATILLALTGCCRASFAHADCRPTASPAALTLPLSPVRIAVPKNAPNGTLLGSAHAAFVQDIPFVCEGPDNVREVRVTPQPDLASGPGRVYATGLPGIGFRIVTRGGSFAGIDDGPRDGTYKVKLPPHAHRLTGFAADVDFVKTGEGSGGVLAPGKLASVIVGGATLVDVVVPNEGIAFYILQCAPVAVGGEVSAGVGTMGAFSQEALVIGAGCNSGINAAIELGQGYVYGRRPALSIDAPAVPKAHGTRDTPTGSAGSHGTLSATAGAARDHDNKSTSLLDGSSSNGIESDNTQWSGGGFGVSAGMGNTGSRRR